MDPKTGVTTDFEQDPLKKVDLEDVQFSDVTKELVFTEYYDEKPRMYFRDKKFEADYNFLKSKFPGSEVAINSQTKDERKWMFTVHGDTKVSSVYFFDRDSKKIIEQYTPRPKLKPYEQYLSPMQPVTYKSSDSLEIPAYLTLPKNAEAKNLPLLVFPHGGPWARSYWGFNGFSQFFANRGFAVLDPNFRGSTGYGKKFIDAGNLQWGKLMQDDITWGVKDLVAKGIVDPKRVAIMGGSYGGYATLAGLAFTPDVYAAGVDIVGPSNLFTLLSSIPPYWEAGRKIFTLRMGDESTEEGKKLLTAASPLFSAQKIKAPLMIIQGANDPRVKQPESDQIVMALRDLNRDVQYILADDEGHGFGKPVNNMAMIAASEKFLADHVGTRYQKDMPENVAKRLKEMTVDIKTVKLAEKLDVKVPATLPPLSGDFTEGVYNYAMNIAVARQNIKMDMQRTVKKDGNNWVVTDAAKSMMGDMTDTSVFTNKGEFVKKTMVQGPANITFVKNGSEIKMNAMGKEMSEKIDGAYISEGSGSDMIMARMPLKEGFTTSFYTVDSSSMKAKKWIMKVEGKEKINGVDTWKVTEVNAENPKEKATLWLDPVKKMAKKIEATSPAMNNALITVEMK